MVFLGLSAVNASATVDTSVYTLLSDMGSMYMQYGLTTIDGEESWTEYSSAYLCSNKKSQGLNVQITGVSEACEITELYKYYDNNASPVFKSGTSYQLYLPLVKQISDAMGIYKWLPMQSLYAPDCTVRAYLAPEIYTDYEAVCTDTIDGNVVYLTVSVPVLEQDYYALEVRLHHCASGCYINSQVMLYTAILESYNLYYYNYNLAGDYPRYKVLSESEQADIFTPVVDDSASGGVDLSETNTLIGKIKEGIQNVVDTLVALPSKIWDTISTGLHDLFIPSAQAVSDFRNNMLALFADHFGALYDCVDIVHDYVVDLNVTSVKDTITFPVVTLDLAGVPFAIGGWDVKIVPDGFDVLFDAVKWAIDAVCTLAFVNTMRERFDDLMVGGDQDVN